MEQQPAPAHRIMKVVRRRKRQATWEAELRAKVLDLKAERDIEIMQVAALTLVLRRLDEIKHILGAAHLDPSSGLGLVHSTLSGNVGVGASQAVQAVPKAVSEPPIQNPCGECGRESVYRTRRNKFNRTGTWLCPIHLGLKYQYEQVGTARPQLVDAQEAVPVAPDKKDTGGDVSMADAMAEAAFGMG